MRVGVVILPDQSWAKRRRTWQRAEEMGFDHAWTYDHLAWGALRDAPWFGAVPSLAAAATVTSRIRLGTLVASPNFRHPVPFARELISLDDISGGRITLGIGAGGSGFDAVTTRAEAWSRGVRADRFAEFVDLLDQLLRQPVVDHAGRFYSAHGARNHPGCVQQPRIPFAVAAGGPRGMRLAARQGQAWVTLGETGPSRDPVSFEHAVPILRGELERLDSACAEVGRDPNTLPRLLLAGARVTGVIESVEAFRDACGRFSELGFSDVVIHWPRPDDPFRGQESVLEKIANEALPRGG